MRKSSKDCRADRGSVNSRIQAEMSRFILGGVRDYDRQHLLSIPRQAIRDYVREGRTYGKRYKFKMLGTISSEGVESEPEASGITMRELAEL